MLACIWLARVTLKKGGRRRSVITNARFLSVATSMDQFQRPPNTHNCLSRAHINFHHPEVILVSMGIRGTLRTAMFANG